MTGHNMPVQWSKWHHVRCTGREGGRHGRWPSVTRERSYGIINDEEATQTLAKRDIPRRRLWWRGCVVPHATTAVVPAVCHYQQGGSWEAQISGKETLQGHDRNMRCGGGGRERQERKRRVRETVRWSTNSFQLWSYECHYSFGPLLTTKKNSISKMANFIRETIYR